MQWQVQQRSGLKKYYLAGTFSPLCICFLNRMNRQAKRSGYSLQVLRLLPPKGFGVRILVVFPLLSLPGGKK
jgi:hypothetical protein